MAGDAGMMEMENDMIRRVGGGECVEVDKKAWGDLEGS